MFKIAEPPNCQTSLQCPAQDDLSVNISKNECGTQCVPISTASVPCQSVETSDSSVQVSDSDLNISHSKPLSQLDMGSLIKFLANVESRVSRALLDNLRQGNLMSNWRANWGDSEGNFESLQTDPAVEYLYNLRPNLNLPRLKVTCLKWSEREMFLAGSFCHLDPNAEDRFQLRGVLCIWSLLIRSQVTPDTPQYVLQLDCQLNMLLFHSDLHRLLIGGSSDGNLYAWLIEETSVREIAKTPAKSKQSLGISAISFIPKRQKALIGKESEIEIVSSSEDGSVVIWSLNVTGGKFELLRILDFKEQIENVGTTTVDKMLSLNSDVIVCGMFSGKVASWRIAGDLFHQYLSSISPKEQAHIGPILRMWRISDDKFMSVGSDGTFKIWKLEQSIPLSSSTPIDIQSHISCVDFSISKDLFAVGTAAGAIHFIHCSSSLRHSKTIHLSDIPAIDSQEIRKKDSSELTGSGINQSGINEEILHGRVISWNSSRPYLAVGDSTASIHVWKI